MTTMTPPQLGVVESPDLAFALTLMGYGVIGGGSFRDAAMAIRSHESDSPIPVIVANVAGTGLRSWVSRQESMGSRVVVLRTQPDGPIPEGVGATGALPLSVNDVMALAGWGASAHPIGSALIAADFTIAEVAAYRPTEPAVVAAEEPAPALAPAPVLQAAPAFEPAPVVEAAPAAPVVESAPVVEDVVEAFEFPRIATTGDDDLPDWAREEFNIPQPVSAFADRKPVGIAPATEIVDEPAAEADDVDEDPIFPEPLTAFTEPVAVQPIAAPQPVVEAAVAPVYVAPTPVVDDVVPAPIPEIPAPAPVIEPARIPVVATAPEKTFEELMAEQEAAATPVAAPAPSIPAPAAPVAEVDFDSMVRGYGQSDPVVNEPVVVAAPVVDEEIDFDSLVNAARLGENAVNAAALNPVVPAPEPARETPAAPQYVAPAPAPAIEYATPVAAPAPAEYVAPTPQPAAVYEAPVAPQYVAPTPAVEYQAPVAAPIPAPAVAEQPLAGFGGLGNTIVSYAGKGGVGKSTFALTLAHRAASAGLRVAVVDMNRGQGDIRSYLRLGDQNLPSIYNAAVTGRPEDAVITPDQIAISRPGLAPLGFAVVLAPPTDLADPSLVTASVYANTIKLLQQKTDLVIIDTQIAEAHDTSGLIDHLVVPILLGGGWGLGVTDMSNPGLNNLLSRTRDFITRGVLRERLLLTVNKAAGFGAQDHAAIDQAFSAYATFVGAAGDDLGFANEMNKGNIDSANPTIGPVVDAALLRITGDSSFAAAAPRRRGLFGRRK